MAEPLADTFAILYRAYRAVFLDRRNFLDIAWPWLSVSTLSVYSIERFRPPLDEMMGDEALFFTLLSVLHLVALIVFQSKWTRWLLLSEKPQGLRLLTFGGRELRVFLAAIVSGLPMAVALVMTMLAVGSLIIFSRQAQSEPVPNWIIWTPFSLLPGLYLWLRLSLAPALAALEQRGKPLFSSWRLTRKRAFRLFLAVLLSVLPLYGLEIIATFILAKITMLQEFRPLAFHDGAAGGVVLLVTILINFAILSVMMSAQAFALESFRQADGSDQRPTVPQDPA
jgi:hypothetical protein